MVFNLVRADNGKPLGDAQGAYTIDGDVSAKFDVAASGKITIPLPAGVREFNVFIRKAGFVSAEVFFGEGRGKRPWTNHLTLPMVAGITIPTFILIGLAAVPFVDRNPSNKPGDRKLAITLFTILFMFGATLTIIGCFFRGPGYNWVWPWSQGIFFDL